MSRTNTSTRGRRPAAAGVLLGLGALAAACAGDPAPSSLGRTSPPMDVASLPPATVGLSATATLEGEVAGPAMRRGLADYFARNVPQWRAGAPSGADDLRLICASEHDGFTNCADVVTDCRLLHAEREVRRFRMRRPSETCDAGDDPAHYRAQGYNTGVALGAEFARQLRQEPDLLAELQTAADARALAEAARSGDRETLQRIRDARPGTEDARTAEAALARLDREEAEARLAAEQAEAAAEAAEASAAAAPTVAEPSAQPSAAPAATEPAGLSCYDPRALICVDLTFPSRAERDAAADTCRAAGSRVLDAGQACDPNGWSCRQEAGGAVEVTWTYFHEPADVRAACLSTGGTFSEP